MAGEELTPFERAALDTRQVLIDFGPLGQRMEQVHALVAGLVDDLGRELEKRGKPQSPRASMEYNLLAHWAQLCSNFEGEYLRVAIQQGSQIGRLPKGPQVVDPRKLMHGPDRGRLQ